MKELTVYSFIANMEIDNGFNKTIKFPTGEQLKITRMDDLDFFQSPNTISILGKANIYNLKKFPCIKVEKLISEDDDEFLHLDYIKSLISQIIYCTWLVSDNSYFIYTTVTKSPKGIGISNESTLITNAFGGHASKKLTNGDFKKAELNFALLEVNKVTIKVPTFTDKIDENFCIISSDKTLDYNTLSRFQRLWRFIVTARTERFIPTKITYYMTALEAVVSTNDQEVSHQVSDRVARLLGESKDERVEIYRNLKTAYNIRSKYIHGSGLKNQELEKVSSYVDNLTRRLLLKMLLDFPEKNKLNNNEYNSWFIEMSFDY